MNCFHVRFIINDDCGKKKAYVCQTVPYYEEPDNECPGQFFPYKDKCFMQVADPMNFTEARTNCANHGSVLHASKNLADFKFIQEYAYKNSTFILKYRNKEGIITSLILVRTNIWMGVTKGAETYFYDSDPSLNSPLQKVTDDELKEYADGSTYLPENSFDFEFSTIGTWNGPCLYLKASVYYGSRDTKCSPKYASICEWNSESIYHSSSYF